MEQELTQRERVLVMILNDQFYSGMAMMDIGTGGFGYGALLDRITGGINETGGTGSDEEVLASVDKQLRDSLGMSS